MSLLTVMGRAGLAFAVAGCWGWLAVAAEVTGTATYRERILLPADAVLEVVLEDVSRADALSVTLGRVTDTGLGAPPYDFAIPYDPAGIDARGRYAVRARITLGGTLRFTSDTVYPVLTGDAPDHVDVVMIAVAEADTDGAAATDAGTGAPVEEAVPTLKGLVAYMADAALFTDCRSGRSYPIAFEGDWQALEHAYLASGREPGGKVLASFEGRIEDRPEMDGEGEEPTLIVERFLGVWPDLTCEQALGDATLLNTEWRIVSLLGEALAPGEGTGGEGTDEAAAADGAEASLVLDEAETRFAATVGCNRLAGGFEIEEMALSFGPAAMTMMACPPPLDRQERALGEVLAATAGWRIEGPVLHLLDADGIPIAELRAVYHY